MRSIELAKGIRRKTPVKEGASRMDWGSTPDLPLASLSQKYIPFRVSDGLKILTIRES